MNDENILFIVNPHAAGKRTGKNWEKTYEQIKKQLQHQSSYEICDGIGTGIDTTRDAARSGDFTCIVSVGGEGTANEVVNGIMESPNKPKIGFIRSGTVNDYLTVIGWPESLESQVKLINKGISRPTPLTRAIGDITRYSLNIGDVGVSANVSYKASVQRKLIWIRSGIRYDLLALSAIMQWSNIPAIVKTDDREVEGNLSLLMAGFSTQSGEFKITYHAEPFGEKMAYTFGMNFSKLEMVRLLGTLKKGEHTEEKIKGLYMGHSSEITIDAEKTLLFEVDGEPFSYNSTRIKLQSVPKAIEVLDPTS